MKIKKSMINALLEENSKSKFCVFFVSYSHQTIPCLYFYAKKIENLFTMYKNKLKNQFYTGKNRII